VLIGPQGTVKDHIEKNLSVRLDVESETGDITLSLAEDEDDPSLLFKARDVVLAIRKGFSPDRA